MAVITLLPFTLLLVQSLRLSYLGMSIQMVEE
jgi:hypothetical protein